MSNKIIITKKIAKQGKNLLIVIPSYLKEFIKAGEVVKIEIEKLKL
jgi:hypothetical protein